MIIDLSLIRWYHLVILSLSYVGLVTTVQAIYNKIYNKIRADFIYRYFTKNGYRLGGVEVTVDKSAFVKVDESGEIIEDDVVLVSELSGLSIKEIKRMF